MNNASNFARPHLPGRSPLSKAIACSLLLAVAGSAWSRESDTAQANAATKVRQVVDKLSWGNAGAAAAHDAVVALSSLPEYGAGHAVGRQADAGTGVTPVATQAPGPTDGVVGDPDSWITDEFKADWGLGAIGAQHAYARGLTGQGVRLGILDTGTSSTHTEFAGSGRLQPIAFSYDYGDGFVFDVDGGAGYLVFGDHGTHVGGTIAASRNQDGTHGVAFGADLVAGSVGGIADTNILMPYLIGGVNEWVEQYGLPPVTEEELRSVMPDRWGLDFLDEIMATNYDIMAEQGVRAINNSWGYGMKPGSTFDDVAAVYEEIKDFPTVDAATRAVRDHDVLFVFSAGNDSSVDPDTGEPILTHASVMGTLPVFKPELEDNWLTVVSLDENLERSWFSSICGQTKDWCVSAPGGGITSSTFDAYPFSDYRLRLVGEAISLANYYGIPGATTEERLENLRLALADDPGWQAYFLQTGVDITRENAFFTALQDMPEPAQDSLYADYSGTSMAAPHVTGALGLLMERFPYLDNSQVRDVLLTTATDLGETGVDEIYGWGLVNLRKAIDGPGLLRVDTEVVMNQPAGGEKVWEGDAWDDWRNDIGGPGRLTKSGIGWLRLSGDNTFGGATVREGVLELDGDNSLTADVQVDGGLFVLDGSLQQTALTVDGGEAVIDGEVVGGLTTIGAGGRLGGNGTLGDTVVAGTIAPGSSIGTLTVDGDYTQQAGSVFEAELLPPDSADLLQVTGSAKLLGGTVVAIPLPGAFNLGQTYALVTAAGGISGEFADIDHSALSPFLALDLVYTANDISIDVNRGLSLASAAATYNQRSAATAADALSVDQGLLQPLTQLFPAEAMAAIDQLTGELHASTQSVLIDGNRLVRNAALARAHRGQDAFTAQSDEGGHSGAWAELLHGSGRFDSDSNAARTDYSGDGTLVGYDYQFEGGWRIGGLGGIGRYDVDVRDRASQADVDSRTIGLYGGQAWGGFGLRAGLTYAWHDVETDRRIDFPEFQDRTHAAYDARTRQAFVEGGYRIATGAWEFEPYAQLAQVRVDTDGFQESGGAAALTGRGADARVDLSTIGVRFGANLKGSGQEQTWLSLRGGLGYRKAGGDRQSEVDVAWTGGGVFNIHGAPIADHATLLDLGFAARLSRNSLLEIGYSGQLADEASDHGASARFSVQF
jgi:subtilase-type serine protease